MRLVSIQSAGAAAAWVIFLAALVLFLAGAAFAHTEVILQCDKNLTVKNVVRLGDQIQYENGMIGERYDRNGDGRVDIETLSVPYPEDSGASTIDGKTYVHRRFPLFYVVDLDLDGQPDATYIDKTPDGVNDPLQHCENVVLYENLNVFRGLGDPHPDYEKKNQL